MRTLNIVTTTKNQKVLHDNSPKLYLNGRRVFTYDFFGSMTCSFEKFIKYNLKMHS